MRSATEVKQLLELAVLLQEAAVKRRYIRLRPGSVALPQDEWVPEWNDRGDNPFNWLDKETQDQLQAVLDAGRRE